MQAFVLLSLVAAAVAMPWGSDLSSVGHAPVTYTQVSQPQIVKQLVQPQLIQQVQPQLVQQVQQVQPQIVHAAPQYVQAAPQYIQAPQIIKTVQGPAASSYSSFSQVHHSVPVVKQVYAQPIVKQVVAQPVYTQQVVKQVVAQPVYTQQVVKQVVAQPVYTQVAQPVLKQLVSAQPSYSHNSW